MTVNQGTKPIIEFENVAVKYGETPIFRSLNFSLSPGSFHYLTGPSGAGKTTLLKLMYLGHLDFEGTIRIFDETIKCSSKQDLYKLRRRIGVVFQDFYLLDHMSALDNVALPLQIKGTPLDECHERAKEMLDWVGLSNCFDAHPNALSGGQKQRVVIARAVAGNPDIILADEPTGNVDDKVAVQLVDLFQTLNKVGKTIIFATHNRDLVTEFSHPEIHIADGKVEFVQPHKVTKITKAVKTKTSTARPRKKSA